MSKPIYFVTGANGFIGASLCRRLVSEGATVRALFHSNRNHPFFKEFLVEEVWGDIANAASYEDALCGVDGVFHCGALVSFLDAEFRQMMRTNAEGTRTLLDACDRQKTGRIVFLSAGAVWGTRRFANTFITEKSEYNSHRNDGYSESKIQAEKHCCEAVSRGQDVVIVNPTTVYGEGDFGLQAGGRVVKTVATSTFPFSPPGGTAWIDIFDLLQGLRLAFERGVSGEQYILSNGNIPYTELFGEIRRICSGYQYLFRVPEIFKGVFKLGGALEERLSLLGLNSPISFQQLVDSFEYKYFSNRKATTNLGFSPTLDLSKSLHSTKQFSLYHQL